MMGVSFAPSEPVLMYFCKAKPKPVSIRLWCFADMCDSLGIPHEERVVRLFRNEANAVFIFGSSKIFRTKRTTRLAMTSQQSTGQYVLSREVLICQSWSQLIGKGDMSSDKWKIVRLT